MSADNDLWYVKTPDGDVNRVTLDQLDEAFNAGKIDENVMVLGAGQTKWARLGELLGLDEPAPAPSSVAPRSTFAPIPIPNSLRPVSMDLSDDLDAAPFQKKSRKGVVVGAMVGLMALGGIGFAATRASSSSSATVAAAAAPAPPPVTAAAPPPAVVAPPTPPAVTAVDARFSDDQKARLKAADEERNDKAKAKKKARAGAAAPHSAKYKSQGFTSGGNKYDPLNANL
jgi:hypothetical protein